MCLVLPETQMAKTNNPSVVSSDNELVNASDM
jgi:hypothetical protein